MSKEFDNIKEKLMTSLVLQGAKWKIIFQIHIDAHDRDLGAIIGQQESKYSLYIYYINKKLS